MWCASTSCLNPGKVFFHGPMIRNVPRLSYRPRPTTGSCTLSFRMRHHSWTKDILHHERCQSFSLQSQTLTLHLTCNIHRFRQACHEECGWNKTGGRRHRCQHHVLSWLVPVYHLAASTRTQVFVDGENTVRAPSRASL